MVSLFDFNFDFRQAVRHLLFIAALFASPVCGNGDVGELNGDGMSDLVVNVSFGVYSDANCITPLRNRPPGKTRKTPTVSVDSQGTCFVMSYTSPLFGHVQTNAFGHFHCTETSVTWTHWPGSTTCGEGELVLVDSLHTDRCMPVMTHLGITYQKLVNYDPPCTATYVYPAEQQYSAETHGQGVGVALYTFAGRCFIRAANYVDSDYIEYIRSQWVACLMALTVLILTMARMRR